MFVLRSHEPETRSIPRPESGSIAATTDEGEPPQGERPDPVVGWQELRENLRQNLRQDRDLTRSAAPTPDAGAESQAAARTGQRHRAPMHMPLFAAAFAVRFGGPAVALECPKHLADAQALIDKIRGGIDRIRNRVPLDTASLVDALLDDAQTFLDAARQNHEQPRGPYDHARAFAKADAALGHARAAEIVYSRCPRD